MKKIIIMLFCVLSICAIAKPKLKNKTGLAIKGNPSAKSTDMRSEINSKTTDTMIDDLDEYYSILNYDGKKYKIFFVDDLNLFEKIRSNLSKYKNIGVINVTSYNNKRLICLKEYNNYSTIFWAGKEKIKVTSRGEQICSTKGVNLVLSVSEKIESSGLSYLNIDTEGKKFLTPKIVKEKNLFN